ncbi:protein FAM177A1 isoform X2 [Seriola aureovittata]|uniref:protein FAM177A1 isoform X2 n=1 Tax=Seriola aureovittata TaxID=2871759 RepID=UPI0024BE71B1|nr:protein FAM177A1 isoform X2 [Seriola aureovittata]
MNNQEVIDTQETDFSGPLPSKQKKIIHFSSGETLEEEDSEEEEEPASNRPPFREPTERTRFSFKNVAILVGRISLLTCDFLGERLAGALGLNAAKYQYAIDQYQHDHKKTSSQTTDGLMEGQAEIIQLSPGHDDESHYGATGGARHPAEPLDEKHLNRKEGYRNRSYQADEDCLK